MTETENLAESQAAVTILSEKAANLSINSKKRHAPDDGKTISEYLKKLYAVKRSVLDDDIDHFKSILSDMEPPKTVFACANECQRSQIQVIVADLLHDSISMQNRDAYIFGLAKIFDINERNNLGFIPLHLAVGRGKFKIVSMLVRSGSNVNLQNDLGRAPLHIAVLKGITEIANFLLAHGAFIDVADGERWTPLHWACRNHHLEMVRLLILRGARLDVQTNKGLRPLDMSLTISPNVQQWHPMTAWNLIVHGANRLSPSAFRQWLNEVLGGKRMPLEYLPVISQLLLLFTKAALIDRALIDEATAFFTIEDLNEARQVSEEPRALVQLCRVRVRALLERGAAGRSFVDNASKLDFPKALRQFILLKS